MKRIKVYDGDGKSREEKESCFPIFQPKGENKGASTQ